MKSKKNILRFLLVLIVIAVTGVGATIAYLHSVTETKKNAFSSSKYASIQLREEKWDGYTFADETTSNGQSAKPSVPNQETLGVNRAMEYLPGETLPKNPQVKNNGSDKDGISVYTAIKVEYFKGETKVDYTTFKTAYLKEAGIAFDNSWEAIQENTAGQIFLYNKVLAVNETTTDLFQNVPLSLDIELIEGKLPEFEVRVTAYAIQSANISAAEAKAEMLNFAK